MSVPIKTCLNLLIPEEHRWKLSLFEQWPQIIGNLQDKVTLVALQGQVVTLGVFHAGWAHELSFLIPVIKQKINLCLGCDRIKVVRFVVVQKNQKTNGPYKQAHKNYDYIERDDTIALGVREQKALFVVQDDQLRQSLELFYKRCYRLKNLKER